ncbi:MAG TPA: hypothetical protein VFO45_06610 [Sphingomicrobium sp.]|nr:hypothetical protein [Sphingomicrobium sp.]
MPASDPNPCIGSIRRRALRVMRVAALFAVAIGGLAVVLVARGDTEPHVQMLIAAALAVALAVLLGIALMALVYLGSRIGQSPHAAKFQQKDEHDARP